MSRVAGKMSLVVGKMSRVAGKMSRVAGKMSRVAGKMSQVNCRGFRKLSQVRKIELLLFPSFPKTISIIKALN